jgi:pyruvate dehydrogenase phosphatase
MNDLETCLFLYFPKFCVLIMHFMVTSVDGSCGLDWHTCYLIIRGVCEGLNYLHNGSKDPIFHLDLKPANILLNKGMVPKIGDFGLSRLCPSAKTCTTIKIIGTP